jgi:hypothetical protein
MLGAERLIAALAETAEVDVNPMALTFRSKLVRDQRFSPKIAGSRTRLEQKLAALGREPVDCVSVLFTGWIRRLLDNLDL